MIDKFATESEASGAGSIRYALICLMVATTAAATLAFSDSGRQVAAAFSDSAPTAQTDSNETSFLLRFFGLTGGL